MPRDREVTIHVVGVGDPQATGEEALDEKTLRSIAAATEGSYFHAADRGELETIYRRIDELKPRELQTLTHRPKLELFHWPLGALVLLTLAYHAALAGSTLLRERASEGVANA